MARRLADTLAFEFRGSEYIGAAYQNQKPTPHSASSLSHLLSPRRILDPSEKEVIIAGRARAQKMISLSAGERGLYPTASPRTGGPEGMQSGDGYSNATCNHPLRLRSAPPESGGEPGGCMSRPAKLPALKKEGRRDSVGVVFRKRLGNAARPVVA